VVALSKRMGRVAARTFINTRVRSQIASTVSFALGVPATRVQTLSVQEMFVLCQQHGFEVDITLERPAALREGEISFSAELDMAA
jgi:hypothetical protein